MGYDERRRSPRQVSQSRKLAITTSLFIGKVAILAVQVRCLTALAPDCAVKYGMGCRAELGFQVGYLQA
jgi:hypothetical protein